jgi:hypothetical protein
MEKAVTVIVVECCGDCDGMDNNAKNKDMMVMMATPLISR